MRTQPITQSIIHPGLPSVSSRFERLDHIRIKPHSQLHLRATANRPAAHRSQLLEFRSSQFMRVRIGSNTGLDLRVFLVARHDQFTLARLIFHLLFCCPTKTDDAAEVATVRKNHAIQTILNRCKPDLAQWLGLQRRPQYGGNVGKGVAAMVAAKTRPKAAGFRTRGGP